MQPGGLAETRAEHIRTAVHRHVAESISHHQNETSDPACQAQISNQSTLIHFRSIEIKAVRKGKYKVVICAEHRNCCARVRIARSEITVHPQTSTLLSRSNAWCSYRTRGAGRIGTSAPAIVRAFTPRSRGPPTSTGPHSAICRRLQPSSPTRLAERSSLPSPPREASATGVSGSAPSSRAQRCGPGCALRRRRRGRGSRRPVRVAALAMAGWNGQVHQCGTDPRWTPAHAAAARIPSTRLRPPRLAA